MCQEIQKFLSHGILRQYLKKFIVLNKFSYEFHISKIISHFILSLLILAFDNIGVSLDQCDPKSLSAIINLLYMVGKTTSC